LGRRIATIELKQMRRSFLLGLAGLGISQTLPQGHLPLRQRRHRDTCSAPMAATAVFSMRHRPFYDIERPDVAVWRFSEVPPSMSNVRFQG
jgi:hypothetical protein